MSESDRIFPDISKCDCACCRVCLCKLSVLVVPAVYMGVVPLGGGGKAEPDEPLVADLVPHVPPLCGPAGAAVL